jgi:retron-type reverse transcriptase
VLRGGAWNNNHRNVRCAYRNTNNPNNRNNNVGFRVVLVGAACLSSGLTLRVSCLPEMRRGHGFAAEASLESQRGRVLAALCLVQSRTNSNRPAPWARPWRGPPLPQLLWPCEFVVGTQVPQQRTGVRSTNRQNSFLSQAGRLYAQLCSWDNLLLAYRKAAKGKRGLSPAAAFEYHLEDNLIALQKELTSRTYRPGPYASFYIHEPKRRLISAAPFRDRVVHHALCNVIEPLFERSFIAGSYANRVGKGTHRALDRCQQFARHYPYALQCDVRQFFPSIDHAILREILGRKIADARTLWLVECILVSGVGVLSEEYDMAWFPGDDLLAAGRPRGLPIGNLTSQFWANCYLNPFDHFVKREMRCPAYLRYVDDFLLFGDDKGQLWQWKSTILKRLARLRLTIHEQRAQVWPTGEGIPFLGFVVRPNQRRLKRRNGVAYARRLRHMARQYAAGALALEQVTASVQGWVNHARYGNTTGLRHALLGNVSLTVMKG